MGVRSPPQGAPFPALQPPVAAMKPRTSSSLRPPAQDTPPSLLHPPVPAMRTSSSLYDSRTSTLMAMVTRRGQSAEGAEAFALPPLPFRMDAWKASTVPVSHSHTPL